MTDHLHRFIWSSNDSFQNIAQEDMSQADVQVTAELATGPARQPNLVTEIQALRILDSSDDCIKVLDREGRILFMNRVGQASLGIEDITPWLNTPWVEFWLESERQAAIEAIGRAGAGEVCTVQGYCPTMSGEPKWWDNKISPIRGANGQVELLLCISRDITERRRIEEKRKQAEYALRSSEQQFCLFVAASSDMVYKMSADWSEMRQLEGKDFVASAHNPSQNWLELSIPQEDRQQVQAAIQQAICTKSTFELEHRVIRLDGTVGWTFSRAIPLLDAQNQIVEWLGTASDVTARKQAEQAIRSSEEKYRSLFESMDEGFCILQLIFDRSLKPVDYRFIVVNPVFEQLTGMKNALGRTIRELVPDIEESWFDIYGQVALTGESTRLVNQSESMGRWFDVNAFRIGEPHERKVAVLFNDISERKRAEAAVAANLRDTQLLSDLSARLLSESDIQVLYDEILVAAIALVQADAGSFQFFDSARQELLLLASQGFSPEMGQHFNCISTSFNTSCGIALATRERSFVDFELLESDDPDGSGRRHIDAGYLCAQSTPLISRKGKLIGMVSTHWRRHYRPSERELRFLDLLARQAADLIEQRQDEAERKRLLAQEKAARSEAERANRIKDEFLAVLSHELRTPLNPILGWSTLLQNSKLDAAKTAQALAIIQRNAKLQSELIEDLLDVSRILRGKLSLNVVPVNLELIVRAAMETVRLAAEAKSIDVQALVEPNVGLVLGDSTRLQQVIWNLLSNAVKFTPSGGQVNVRLQRLQSCAQITVSDSGQGIAPEFLPYVFDCFRQADAATTRKFGGLGLGLAIVRHLVELHGGTVKVQSFGEGQGATFVVQLPTLPTALKANPDEQLQEQFVNLNGIKILVVDDEIDTRELLAFVLEQEGARVRAVSSASEALAILPQFQPDLLLSDIGMPNMDGYMLIQQVRALLPHDRQIPAIALTAYAGDIDRQQVKAAGFQKHISKPIEPIVLIQEIASLVRST